MELSLSAQCRRNQCSPQSRTGQSPKPWAGTERRKGWSSGTRHAARPASTVDQPSANGTLSSATSPACAGLTGPPVLREPPSRGAAWHSLAGSRCQTARTPATLHVLPPLPPGDKLLASRFHSPFRFHSPNAGEINARRSPEPANRLNHGQGRKDGKDGAQAPATRLVLHRRSINLRPMPLFPAPLSPASQGLPAPPASRTSVSRGSLAFISGFSLSDGSNPCHVACSFRPFPRG